MLFELLLAGPIHELIPVSANVNSAEPMNPIDRLIHYFQRSISVTHETLPDEIDAVADMTWPNIHMYVFIGKLCPVDGRIMIDPVAFADIVL